jgi:2-polyprenyl-3-methyl-5-hydroxy-6-metoxy-1,4-benzoquinol methylase
VEWINSSEGQAHIKQRIDLVIEFTKQLEFVGAVSLLNIGDACGDFSHAAISQGWNAKGLELSPQAVEMAKERFGLSLILGTLDENNSKIPDESIDVITLWDVFEHFPNPNEEGRKIQKKLKDGGLLIMGLPNLDSLLADLWGDNYLFGEHLFNYTPKTIRKILENLGLEVLEVRTVEIGLKDSLKEKDIDQLKKDDRADHIFVIARRNKKIEQLGIENDTMPRFSLQGKGIRTHLQKAA